MKLDCYLLGIVVCTLAAARVCSGSRSLKSSGSQGAAKWALVLLDYSAARGCQPLGLPIEIRCSLTFYTIQMRFIIDALSLQIVGKGGTPPRPYLLSLIPTPNYPWSTIQFFHVADPGPSVAMVGDQRGLTMYLLSNLCLHSAGTSLPITDAIRQMSPYNIYDLFFFHLNGT